MSLSRTWNSDELAAVLDDRKANALNHDLVLHARSCRVRRSAATVHGGAINMMDELGTFPSVSQSLLLESRLFDSSRSCLGLSLVNRRIDYLQMPVGLGYP